VQRGGQALSSRVHNRVGMVRRKTTARAAPAPRAKSAPASRRTLARGRTGVAAANAVTLKAVRELAGMTQEQVAAASGVTQIEVSRAERRADHKLSTLRRYVVALGGELEVWVQLGEKRVRLRGV
jgi:Helix-turn-helix